jgi:hypothetical protein
MTEVITSALGEVAEILPGTTIPGRIDDLPPGPYHLILPRHASEDGQPICYSQIPAEERSVVDLERQPPAKRHLQVGDILFMSRGTKNRACVMADLPGDGPAVAPIVFHVLRPMQDRVLPGYLAWVLNQDRTQATIAREIRTSSVATPMVPRKDFEKLSIPIPDLERQRQIADLADLMLREQSLRRRLAELTEKRNLGLGSQLLNQLTNASSKNGLT